VQSNGSTLLPDSPSMYDDRTVARQSTHQALQKNAFSTIHQSKEKQSPCKLGVIIGTTASAGCARSCSCCKAGGGKYGDRTEKRKKRNTIHVKLHKNKEQYLLTKLFVEAPLGSVKRKIRSEERKIKKNNCQNKKIKNYQQERH
jgi:hypothetical protein